MTVLFINWGKGGTIARVRVFFGKALNPICLLLALRSFGASGLLQSSNFKTEIDLLRIRSRAGGRPRRAVANLWAPPPLLIGAPPPPIICRRVANAIVTA